MKLSIDSKNSYKNQDEVSKKMKNFPFVRDAPMCQYPGRFLVHVFVEGDGVIPILESLFGVQRSCDSHVCARDRRSWKIVAAARSEEERESFGVASSTGNAWCGEGGEAVPSAA